VVDTPPIKQAEQQPEQQDKQRQAMRNHIIAQRKALTTRQLKTAEHALHKLIKPFVSEVKTLAAYNAINGEISVDTTITFAQHQGIVTLLPIMRGEALVFAPFDSSTRLIKRRFGIMEPDVPDSQCLSASVIDIVLVPLVAFDENCNRMGMGGGFYDRSFAQRRTTAAPPTLMGVAHNLQKVDSVYQEWWDVPLDYIATDHSLFTRPDKLAST